MRVGDLISNKNELIIESEFRVLHLSLLDGFRLFSLIDALPTQWRESLETCISTGDTPFNLSDENKLRWSGQIVLLEKVSYLHQSCPGSYAKWWRIWRPLPDEGYRPEMLWAGMGWEETKTNHPKDVPWRGERARRGAWPHNNNLCATCVCCLEDVNECMVYVCYIVAWARPL